MALDLFSPGAYCRAPGGNLERPEIQAPVVKWMTWSINPDNSGNGSPQVWDKCRSLWDASEIQNFPWLHCRSMADIERLIQVGQQYSSPAIGCNLEDVNTDFTSKGISLLDVAQKLSQWQGPIHMATLCWVQNGQGWSALSRCVAALEIFIDEVPGCKEIQACIDHALAEGLPQVTLLLKTKAPNTPSTYGQFFSICHSLYTADDITPTAQEWAKWEATVPCTKVQVAEQWYEKPYLTGPAVGPEKLPRALYPPSAGKGTFRGDDVTAFKRAISRAGRLEPWAPATWNNTYGEAFAKGDGSGNVGKSGVRGFQRQQWPQDTDMQTGNLGDKTYQSIRRSLISDPESVHYKEPLLDSEAIRLLKKAAVELSEDAKINAFRTALADFCNRSEDASSSAWVYSQARPYSGLGVEPEKAHSNDCSSYVILAYYWGRIKSGLKVPDPSKYLYNGYGNTWDDEDGHPRVSSGNFLVGDLAHYDGHVTICKKAGNSDTSRWSSFGSEPRPEEKTLYYRSDFLKVVRPPLQ